MAATLRELRQRRTSVAATMKITKAMELIAASRVTRAQQKATKSMAYTMELVKAVSAVATYSGADHRLAQEHHEYKRSGVLVICSDRGLAGAYSANIMRATEGLIEHLNSRGLDVDLYTVGRKAKDYFTFRQVPITDSWQGFSEAPHYEHAHMIGTTLIERFLQSQDADGIGELHVVYTRFNSLVSQTVQIVRLLPLQIVDSGDIDDIVTEQLPGPADGLLPAYDFEPDADTVFDALLPMYVIDTIKFMLRESAASELAARQQAMHSASDNAEKLIQDLTRLANQARQAEITQEINEIVGGAGALSQAGQES